MNLNRIACGSCGASLNVPDGVKFVNCLHCGSSLHVQRNQSVAYTEVAQTLGEHAQEISALRETVDIQTKIHEHHRFQMELDRLDRDWDQLTQTSFGSLGWGRHSVPTSRESFQKVVVLLLFLVSTWIFVSRVADLHDLFLRLVIIPVAFLGGEVLTWIRVLRYESMLSEYREKRQAIVARMPR